MNHGISLLQLQKAERTIGGTCFVGCPNLFSEVDVPHWSHVKLYVDIITNTSNTKII